MTGRPLPPEYAAHVEHVTATAREWLQAGGGVPTMAFLYAADGTIVPSAMPQSDADDDLVHARWEASLHQLAHRHGAKATLLLDKVGDAVHLYLMTRQGTWCGRAAILADGGRSTLGAPEWGGAGLPYSLLL